MGSSNTSGPSGPGEQRWGAPPRTRVQVDRVQVDPEQVDPEQVELPAAQGPAAPSEVTANQDRPAARQLPRTGDQQVDDALESLLAVQNLAPGEQVEAYVGAHRALQDRLADLEG